MVRLTAALITRDEEIHIGPCLDCLNKFVDEIVVVDTGSQDQTKDIARAKGARVYDLAWRGDFSHARNAAIDKATGDWILYVDADERVTATGDLSPTLSDPAAVAATVRFRAASYLTPYAEYRLFRNRADIRFRGVIHETILPDILALTKKDRGGLVEAPLFFEHLGYEGDLSHKHRRNRPLLQQAVSDSPERIYLWLALGEAELGLGDIGAAQDAWQRGLETLRKQKPQTANAQIYANLIDLHLSMDEVCIADIDALVAEALQRYPRHPMILWHSARHAEARTERETARALLFQLLDLASDRDSQLRVGYDRRLFGFLAWALLGVCYLLDGKPEDAVKWLRLAHDAEPEDLEVRTKLALAESRLAASR